MGAHPYMYFTPYEADPNAALQALRQREFEAGRYDPALLAADPPTHAFMHSFPPSSDFPAPGAQHGSIEEALAEAMEDSRGTGSILDLLAVTDRGGPLCATMVREEDVAAIFGSARLTRAELENALENPMIADRFWDTINRAEGRVITIYKDGEPEGYFFAGYSLD